MSPNAYIMYTDKGLLCAYPGEDNDEEPCFTWNYGMFEHHMNECITPSMYHFMAGHVADNFTKDDLWDIATDSYHPGELEAAAVDAYFDQPINERITMHEQELVNLRAAKRLAEARESAAIDAMLEENRPFDETSPISRDYAEFMRGIIEKSHEEVVRLESEIHEEEQWRGGHELGAEDDTHLNPYDPMDEF